MAFTVETGAVVAGANSYATIAQYRTHHGDRGRPALITDAGQTDAQVQAALIQASDYIDKRFGRRLRGERKQANQPMEYPRIDAWDEDNYALPEMPGQLLKATVEYAWIATQQTTGLAPIPAASSGIVQELTERVGPISTTMKFADRPMTSTGNLTESLNEYPEADLWMEELIESPATRRIVRG
jgi:hypothetical protein